MNYYDYRSYLNEIIGLLESIQSADETAHTELITEIRENHDEILTSLDAVNTTLSNGFTLISAVICISVAVKVLFK